MFSQYVVYIASHTFFEGVQLPCHTTHIASSGRHEPITRNDHTSPPPWLSFVRTLMQARKLPSIPIALLPILILVVMALVSISFWEIDMLIPLMAAITAAALIAKALGYSWHELEQS